MRVAVLLIACLALSGCASKRTRTSWPCIPAPTKIRFFNTSKKTAAAKKKADVQLHLEDDKKKTDSLGDNEPTLSAPVSIPPMAASQSIVKDLTKVMTGPGGNVSVNAKYRTTSVTVGATIGGVRKSVVVALPTANASGDIDGDEIVVHFAGLGPNKKKTKMTATVSWTDGSTSGTNSKSVIWP